MFVTIASDDRTAEVFRTTIEAATQMKAVLGEQPRPNCLIIDEIDGAPQVSLVVHSGIGIAYRDMRFILEQVKHVMSIASH